MDAKLYCGKIHIVEWLDPRDRRTGRDLFDEVEPMGLMAKPIVVPTEFIAHLRDIRADFRGTRKLPLLQLETHGVYADLAEKVPLGIGAGGEVVTWEQLMAELIPLNRMTGVRLFVNMASCGGLWGIKMLQPADRAAFMAILGPNRTVDEDELVAANIAFYRELFRLGGNGNLAIDAMNAAVAPKPTTFGIYNCERLFMDVYAGFLKTQCIEPILTQRVTSALTKLVAERFIQTGTAPSPIELAEMRRRLRQSVEARADWFNEFRRHHFFIEEVPENDQRFPVTLADCEAAA